jgi:signal peptidase I
MQTILWYFIIISIFLYLIYDTYKDGGVRETVKFVILFGFLFFFIRGFILQPFVVEGPSMSPTFETNNYLLVEKLSLRFSELKRYDIVIFDIPDIENRYHSCLIGIPTTDICFWQNKRYLIKRVVALPGEKIKIINGITTIYNKENKEGFLLKDDFVKYISPISDEKILSDDEYYVMGDNRANSSDSRYFGPVKLGKIVGVPFLRLYPFSLVNWYPGSLDLQAK